MVARFKVVGIILESIERVSREKKMTLQDLTKILTHPASGKMVRANLSEQKCLPPLLQCHRSKIRSLHVSAYIYSLLASVRKVSRRITGHKNGSIVTNPV